MRAGGKEHLGERVGRGQPDRDYTEHPCARAMESGGGEGGRKEHLGERVGRDQPDRDYTEHVCRRGKEEGTWRGEACM